ncbi:MAG TPA: chromate efflux transporter [Gammaproteobacteria bacterium]|nr:chromate efflux transporter [Gammaproteobacteria bacterium]
MNADPFETGAGEDMTARNSGALEVLAEALKLGMTSFGGPIAHLGYFERVYVRRLRWLSAEEYTGLVALCQLLPGPASSQVSFLIGLRRAGWPGAIAAFLGFTLPSALLMYLFAVFAPRVQGSMMGGVLHGLKLVAVAVVAQAVLSMARRLSPDPLRALIAAAAMTILLISGGTLMQMGVLVLGAVGGLAGCRRVHWPAMRLHDSIGNRAAGAALALFLALLMGLPLAAAALPGGMTALADIFYRAGALVFGGGHVVLPLLRDALVPGGWMTDDAFLAGYGFAQAMPGPLFTVSAYLGAVVAPQGGMLPSAGVALGFMFLPGLLIAIAGLRLWALINAAPLASGALAGVNAAVVGILGAALCTPVWTTSVHDYRDAVIAVAGLLLLERWRVPPIAVVILCVVVSAAVTPH